MSKLMRGLVLGAMLTVLSSATAVAAQPPDSRTEAVQRFQAGERASLGQPVSRTEAVQRFRAGERASVGQPVSRTEAVQRFRAGERASVDQPVVVADAVQRFRAGERASADQPVVVAGSPAQPSGRNDTPVGLLAALAAAAVLSLSLDAMLVRRKARKATVSTAV